MLRSLLRRPLAVTTALACVLGFSVAASQQRAHAAGGLPRPDHTVVVIMENHSYSSIIGSSSAPYINSLASQGALFSQSFAVTHPSEPNYLELFSGSTQGITDDSCPHTFSGGNLGSELIGAGLTFTGYSESMPSDGYTGCTSGEYARKHNPWVNFTNVPSADNRTYAAFPTDYTTLPTVSVVVPNLIDDMHDGTIQQGDTWLQNNIDAYAQWAKTHNSQLILTWDEDDSTGNNQIPTIEVGAGVTPGTYSEHITHDNVLRTIEDFYNLPYAGNSANVSPISDIFGTPGNTVTVTNPGNQTGTVGTAASLQIHASDSASGQTLTYSATGLPAGLSINSSTGLISGTPTAQGTSSVTVKATDTTNASGSTTFTWTVNPAGGGGITNGGFETGNLSGWTTSGTTSVVSSGAHSGTYAAQAGSTSPTNGDSSLAQTFTVPSGNGTLSFWYKVTCPDTVQYDWATATLKDNTSGTTSTPLAKTCTNTGTWQQVTVSVTASHSYTLTLTSHDDNYAGDPTYTLFDDVALAAAPSNPIVNGGFETGDLSGWTASGAKTGVTTSGPHSGSYAAQLGDPANPTNGDSSIAQTFTAPSGSTSVSFWYKVTCPDTVQYDWATATLKDNTSATTSTPLAKTCTNTGTWQQVTVSVTASHSYTLTLTSHDDNYAGDPTSTAYDDVTVS